MTARILLALDGGISLEIGSTEVHEETQDTAIPSLLRALADAYDAEVATLLPK
ncbi:hypothetical protein [Streptomyces avermitilis]|uniref:hypothetical protein n=1 Tax=Streptomyces avermitilis TaxID=33903 RepID=UPI00380C452C